MQIGKTQQFNRRLVIGAAVDAESVKRRVFNFLHGMCKTPGTVGNQVAGIYFPGYFSAFVNGLYHNGDAGDRYSCAFVHHLTPDFEMPDRIVAATKEHCINESQ